MYYVKKQFEISGAHSLTLPYKSKCTNIHGHNWVITVYCKSEQLDENGMVIDFSTIKERVKEVIDHKNLNDVLPFNPTAENLAKWICDLFPQCYQVDIEESRGNMASYTKE